MSTSENGFVRQVMAAVGRWCARRPWWVVAGWVAVASAVVALVVGYGRPTDEDVTLPGSDAQAGRDLLDEHFPDGDDATGQVVLQASQGRLDDPAHQAAIAEAAAAIADVEHVREVGQPSAELGTLSTDGSIGYVTVEFDLGPRDVGAELSEEVLAAAEPARDAGLTAVPAGVLANEETDTRTSELLGLGVATIVMLFAFGGVVAAGLPLATAFITLICGVGAIGLAGHATSVPEVATTLGTMIGLGVGIDYALFLVTRYRALLATGAGHRSAAIATVASSGSAVVFAGGTVIVALAGLVVAGIPVLTTLGWTAGAVVLVAVAAATTLLPAVLVLLGPRIDRLRVRRTERTGRSAWGALAARVTRRPWRYAIGSAALLLTLAAPVIDLELGQTDAGSQPTGTAERAGYDLLADGFGPGVNGPLTVVAELDEPASGTDDPRVSALTADLAAADGVDRVQPPRLSADGSVVSVRVIPATAPSDPHTDGTIDSVAAVTVPDAQVHVTGQTATRSAMADRVTDRMPYVIAVVVMLAAVLIMVAFRAPVLAAKAAVMNLLSVGAAYGALTAVFTWGWGIELIGLDGPIPVESYVPMMLFALLFGLSMDYEVFLLTAVQESWLRTGDNRRAVRDGLESTGRVITSAALIMVCVFASFVLHDNPVVKMFGLGMAVAIAIDATIIRGLLVPAVMAMLGRANWWTPRRRRPLQKPDAAAHAGSADSTPEVARWRH